jgi:hypothetical protein
MPNATITDSAAGVGTFDMGFLKLKKTLKTMPNRARILCLPLNK